MEITGLPLHPLVVHAAVVLTPMLAAAAAALALLPRWRWLLRWPTAALAVTVLAVVFLAVQSGQALLEARPFLLDSPEVRAQIATHQDRAQWLFRVMVPFTLIVLAAAWSLPGESLLASGRGRREARSGALGTVLVPLLLLGALAVLVLVVLTGDAGSRAVWG